MKKIFFIISLIFVLTSCTNSGNDVDSTSSATGKWDPFKVDGVTEADLQFGNLRKEKEIDKEDKSDGEKSNDIVTSVRPTVLKFIKEQFEKKTFNKKVGEIEYKLNNKAMSIIFNSTAKHTFKNVGYDYNISIKELEEKYDYYKFVKELKNKDSNLKSIETKTVEIILVKNIDKNSYSSELHALYNKENKSYYIKLDSEVMSIPETIVMSELFFEGIR